MEIFIEIINKFPQKHSRNNYKQDDWKILRLYLK